MADGPGRGLYIDTSALGRVLLREPEAADVLELTADFDRRVSSGLLRLELLRLAIRAETAPESAEHLLRGVALVPVTPALLRLAESVEPGYVATLDAIHLATAIDLAAAAQIDALLTYDRQLAAGAEENGIKVLP